MTDRNPESIIPDAHDEAEGLWLEALIGAKPSALIERSEAQGQKRLVESELIPIRGSEKLTDLGIVLGEPVDDLFRKCTLPEGWKKQASGHSMWSHIVDAKGNERVAIFYKAAFYDRGAHCGLVTRFHAGYECEGSNFDGPFFAFVSDGSYYEKPPKLLYKTEPIFSTSEEARESAEDFMNTTYPGWNGLDQFDIEVTYLKGD